MVLTLPETVAIHGSPLLRRTVLVHCPTACVQTLNNRSRSVTNFGLKATNYDTNLLLCSSQQPVVAPPWTPPVSLQRLVHLLPPTLLRETTAHRILSQPLSAHRHWLSVGCVASPYLLPDGHLQLLRSWVVAWISIQYLGYRVLGPMLITIFNSTLMVRLLPVEPRSGIGSHGRLATVFSNTSSKATTQAT